MGSESALTELEAGGTTGSAADHAVALRRVGKAYPTQGPITDVLRRLRGDARRRGGADARRVEAAPFEIVSN